MRILRFFRFFAWYGQGELDPEGLEACGAAKEQLRILSGERVNAEMMRLLMAPDPATVVGQMLENGILQVLIPSADSVERLASLVVLENQIGARDPLRRFFSIIGSNAETISEIAKDWRFSNADRTRLLQMARNNDMRLDGHEPSDIKKNIYRMGIAAFTDAALNSSVRFGDDNLDHIQFATAWVAPVFQVSGADVLALDIEPGKQVGMLLRQLEDWWIDANFEPGRDELLEKLAAIIESA